MIDLPARNVPQASPTVLRWVALVDKHGSHTGALEALLRQADELERLKVAVRGCGLRPDLLLVCN